MEAVAPSMDLVDDAIQVEEPETGKGMVAMGVGCAAEEAKSLKPGRSPTQDLLDKVS